MIKIKIKIKIKFFVCRPRWVKSKT